ncbi:hypothetical protein ACTXT7_006909 [Hymenolepis weldensis]
MRPRMVLPIRLYSSSSITLNERGRGRSLKNSGRPSVQKPSISTAHPLPYTSAVRGNGFRGRGRFTRGRGAARALQKRRRRTRTFNHGGGVGANNADPEKVRADLDKELNEYMEGSDGK